MAYENICKYRYSKAYRFKFVKQPGKDLTRPYRESRKSNHCIPRDSRNILWWILKIGNEILNVSGGVKHATGKTSSICDVKSKLKTHPTCFCFFESSGSQVVIQLTWRSGDWGLNSKNWSVKFLNSSLNSSTNLHRIFRGLTHYKSVVPLKTTTTFFNLHYCLHFQMQC